MAKLTNGRIIVEVADEKAEHYALFMGYRIMQDETEEKKQEPVIPEPRKPRGRPRKAN